MSLILIAGGKEMVPGQHVHSGSSCSHWSTDLTADQSGFNLGSRPAGTQIRPGPEGEKWVSRSCFVVASVQKK